MWAAARHLRKMAQSPAASPCCSAKGTALGWCFACPVFPAWAVLTLTLCSCPQSRSCFRCQGLLLALCLEVQKNRPGYHTDLSNHTLQTRNIFPRSSRQVHLKLCLQGLNSPSPCQLRAVCALPCQREGVPTAWGGCTGMLFQQSSPEMCFNCTR